MTFIKDLLTVANGNDYDIGRVMAALGMVTFIGLSIADFCYTHKFDPLAWGTGFGLLVTGAGAALMLKHKTEPQGEGTP